MQSEEVTTKDGNKKTVVAGSQKELDEAVRVAKTDQLPVYPNINHPVQKGHDLVAMDGDLNKVLVDGTGAHNSPMDAIDENGKENGDPKVKASGLDEPAYKQVPGPVNSDKEPRTATESEVKEAQGDAEPAGDVEPKPAETKSTKK